MSSFLEQYISVKTDIDALVADETQRPQNRVSILADIIRSTEAHIEKLRLQIDEERRIWRNNDSS